MSGIVAPWEIDGSEFEGQTLEADVHVMSVRLSDRGLDDGDHWLDPSVGIAVGHHCRSALVLSRESRQLMRPNCGRLVTDYNGEIYNFRELRFELQDRSGQMRWYPAHGGTRIQTPQEEIAEYVETGRP